MSKHAVFAAAVLALSLTPVAARAQGREVTGRVTRAVGGVPVGLATIGVLGVLLEAKRRGLVDRVLPYVDRLVAELKFFVSPTVRQMVAELADE